jgi:hypothetical protein
VAGGDGAGAVVRFHTRRTVHLLRGNIPRAIESSEVVAVDKDPLLKRFAALQGAKAPLEQGP